MQIAITGSTGLVGEQLIETLQAEGHSITRIVRQPAGPMEVQWDPNAGTIESSKLEGIEAVIHLAGENIGEGRWTDAKKQRIRDSRVRGTMLLSETLARLRSKPAVLISASAIGYYGDRGDYLCDESTSNGRGFLSDVCVAWESATEPALRSGIRVVNVRIGIVLSGRGGVLSKLKLPFQLGVGGVAGSGKQYWSWIAIDDLIRVFDHCLRTVSLHGLVNAVAPNPASNLEFTKALGRVLHRPTVLPMPAFAARLVLGETADALVLASTRVAPNRLLETHFSFDYPELEPALRHVLGRFGD